MCIYMCICLSVYICISKYMYTYTYTQTHVVMGTYLHTVTHTHTHLYMIIYLHHTRRRAESNADVNACQNPNCSTRRFVCPPCDVTCEVDPKMMFGPTIAACRFVQLYVSQTTIKCLNLQAFGESACLCRDDRMVPWLICES